MFSLYLRLSWSFAPTAMRLIHINSISASFAGNDLYTDLSWSIDDRDRVGLVGPNGAGKSTLLRLILGDIQPDRGAIIRQPDIRLGYLPQDIALPPELTVLEAAAIKSPALQEVEAELERIEAQLTDPAVYESDSRLTSVLSRHETLMTRFEAMNGHRYDSRVRELLAMLGFSRDDLARGADTLSGGQKKLVALTRLAASAPDILLLDEPDNHLDMAGKRQLERFILNYPGSVVIISHDRYLLDEVASQIVELEGGKLSVYHGNYSYYQNERRLRRLRQEQLYTTQQKEIARLNAMIERFERWAKQVLSRKHMLAARQRRRMLRQMEERGEIIDKVSEARLMNLDLPGWRGSKKALELVDVSLAFDDDLLFCDVNLLLRHGDRVGLIGPNGAGKSVLGKLILSQLAPLSGSVKVAPGVRIGYYSQEHSTLSDWLDSTPLDLIRDSQNSSDSTAVNFLLRMAFSYDQARQPIATLSGGECSRLQLALLMLRQPNLLLLDEPTNNLDIRSVEVLEDALDDFVGSALIISHDRYFLDQTVDRVIELRGGSATEYAGGYTEFLEAMNQRNT